MADGFTGPPAVDFYSMLSGLGDTIKAQRVTNARKEAFSNFTTLDPSSPDYGKQALGVAQKLGSVGDQEGAVRFLSLAQSAADKAAAAARDSRDFAFRQTEAQRAQANADRSYSLAADKAPPGFQKAEDGSLKPIPGGPADPEYKRMVGDRQNAPSGYRWIDPANPNAGMIAIPGGPGEKVDAEVAGRLGLAKSFLGQLPEIKKRVAAGEITGPIDAAMAYGGVGGPGEIRRQIDSGAEALLRMLTGAGMNKEEAAQYTRRYQFSPTDTSATLTSKLNQLERELNSVGETVGKGRGGWNPSGAEAAPAATPAAKAAVSAPAGAIAALRKDPRLAAQFDAKYGQGAAQAALSGAQ